MRKLNVMDGRTDGGALQYLPSRAFGAAGDTNKRGPGYLKFNCTLLRDPEYVDKIKSVIRETIDIEGDINVRLLWETLKLKIRTDTIQFSARKKRSKNNLFLALDKRLKRLEKEFQGNPTDEILEIIRLVKQDINDLLQEQINGIIMRSKSDWQEGALFNISSIQKNMKKTLNEK